MVRPNAELDCPSELAQGSPVLERLRSFIQNGGFQDGAKLPTERELARELQVSRPAIREAIKALSILDALDSRRGDGTYLKSRAALTAGWPATVEIGDKRFSMLEVLEFRKMVEPRAAALAATRASEDDLYQIAQLRTELESDTVDWREYGPLDLEFHDVIVRAAGNPVLREVYGYLSPVLTRLRDITIRSAEDWVRFREDHRAIVEAIVRGESDAAESAMLEHMHHIGLDLISKRRR